MSVRSATLHYIMPSPTKVDLVVGVHQGLLLEDVDHGVNLLPLGPRGPLHLLGDGLVQHALHGGELVLGTRFG